MRILAAISGGVDSAVAAARLVEAGHDVVGAHLRTGVEADGEGAGGARACCGADDARDARAVATKLGIPFYVVDVQEAFSRVIDDFVATYAAGQTPSPCILCNRYVKLGRLREIAEELGAGAVATGHYARREVRADGSVRLLRPRDRRKDQTYMLFRLSQQQLQAARFPLGDDVKDTVRAEAERRGLGVHNKPDSQELCFVPAADGPRGYLKRHAPDAVVAGTFVDTDGEVVGTHDGAAGYTMGQRRGLPSLGQPRYIHRVDAASGTITLGGRDELMRTHVDATNVNWVDVVGPADLDDGPVRVEARVRHAGPPAPGHLEATPDGGIRVIFDAPVFAPAPGQALVAYCGDAVLCGGTIVQSPSS